MKLTIDGGYWAFLGSIPGYAAGAAHYTYSALGFRLVEDDQLNYLILYRATCGLSAMYGAGTREKGRDAAGRRVVRSYLGFKLVEDL